LFAPYRSNAVVLTTSFVFNEGRGVVFWQTAHNRTDTVQKGRQPMAINHSPRPLLEGTFKRHAPTGGQSCWFHFIAAVKSDLERLLSSLSIHPLAEKRLIDGTGILTVDEYEGYIFLSLFIIDPSGRMANVRLLAAERHIISYMDESHSFIDPVKERLLDHCDQVLYPGYVLLPLFKLGCCLLFCR